METIEMKIEYEQMEAIKQIYLPKILRDYGIALKETHSESFSGLCPFHNDKNPSLYVSRRNGKWVWHCFGCKASGNVIDFVIKYEKISFAEAYKKLAGFAGNKERDLSSTAQVKEEAVSSAEQPPLGERREIPGLNRVEILKRVMNVYHNTFYEDKRGAEYLAKRGIEGEEIYKSFNIGFVNGSVRASLPASEDNEIIKILKELGILNYKGTEHFYNCVVFPIYDENGNITQVYGRNISNTNEISHLYLPGTHKGVWNFQALKLNKEIIITESIIDALSCIMLGIRNVVPLYGINGLTESHIKYLKEYRTEKANICFDNDEGGQRARQRVKEKIEAIGIKVKDIYLPKEYKDINEALEKGFSLKEWQTIKEIPPTGNSFPAAAPQQLAGEQGIRETRNDVLDKTCEYPKTTKQEDAIYINFKSRQYRIRGLEAKNLEKMRVNIKIQDSESYHLDTLDLYSSKSRAVFVSQCRKIMKAEEKELLWELNKIIAELENIQAESIGIKSQEAAEKQMSVLEEQEAIEQLKKQNLLKEILNDLEKIGYVGEESNKSIGYLVSISRKLEEPLSCVIISQSSAGKSALAEIIEKITPQEECLLYSRITPQALYYMDKDALKRKLLMIEESVGAETADYSIRTLQSKKKLTQAVPIKDPNTGRIRTVGFEVEGPIAYIETTTRPRINQENATRCFELYLDETKEQTRRIQEAQKESKTLSGLNKNILREQLIRKHQNMQRLLNQIKVVNPFANLLDFPADWLRTRRDNLRFLNLIEAVTFLYQHQREVKKTDDGLEYIESTMEDYKIAYSLAKEVLGESFTELKKPQRELLKEVQKLLSKYEDGVTRRQIRESTGLSDKRLRDLLSDLVDLEYLSVVEGKQGKSFRYRLSEELVAAEGIIEGLTKPEELARRLGQAGINGQKAVISNEVVENFGNFVKLSRQTN